MNIVTSKETSEPLVLPVVHLNGTSRDSLIEQLTSACNKARDLLDTPGMSER